MRKLLQAVVHLSATKKRLAQRPGSCGSISLIEVIMARHCGRGSSRPPCSNRSLDLALSRTLGGLIVRFARRSMFSPVILALAVSVVLCFVLPAVWAQVSLEDVHVVPRVEPPKPNALANLDDPSLRTHTKPVKVDVSLVLVPVTITDPMNRLVTGLDKENFQVFEDKEQEEIRHFSSEDAPVSIWE